MAGAEIDCIVGVLSAPEQRESARPGRDILQGRYEIQGKQYLLRVFVDVDRTPAAVVRTRKRALEILEVDPARPGVHTTLGRMYYEVMNMSGARRFLGRTFTRGRVLDQAGSPDWAFSLEARRPPRGVDG